MHAQLLYILIGAMAASLSTSTEAEAAEPAPTTSILRTADDFGVRIERISFEGDDVALGLDTPRGLNDLRVDVPLSGTGDAGSTRLANWLREQLGERPELHGILNQWRFEGRLYDLAGSGRVPEDGIAISGALPLVVGVHRTDDARAEIDVKVPTHLFDIDWISRA